VLLSEHPPIGYAPVALSGYLHVQSDHRSGVDSVNRYFTIAALAILATGPLAFPVQSAAPQASIKVDKPAAMNGTREVVVGSFVVAFLTERSDSAKAGGGLIGSGFGGKSSARSRLSGLADADFQAATDAAFTDFKQQMSGAGYTVADNAPVIEAMIQAGARTEENGAEKDLILGRNSKADARLFSPSGWAGPLVPREYLGMMSGGGFSGNRSAILVSMKGQEFAKSKGQAVLSVLYIIDFAQADTYGGAFRNVSAVKVKAGLAAIPEASKLVVYAPKGQVGTATLREPIAVGGAFGEFADAQSGGEKALNAAVNVIGILGGIGSNSSKKYIMTADPVAWKGGMSELMSSTNAQFIAAMNGTG